MTSKVCKDCGVEKGLAEFYKQPGMADGHLNKCKLCVSARVRKNRKERIEQYAEYDKARANLPHRVEARRKYQEEHKAETSEYKKRWAAENKVSVDASRRKHYDLNREEVIARSKKWAESNPDKVRSAKANNRRKRRAARHASSGSFTDEEFRALCEVYGNRCLACGDTEAALEADHIVPLTRGGSDDIGNIQPLCGLCNRKKFVSSIDYRLAADNPPQSLAEPTLPWPRWTRAAPSGVWRGRCARP